ncbi:MAG: hypothetical protein U0354_12970 [Candidatus Sericytochromatia bacterium]
MSKSNRDLLDKNRESIRRGVYYFGIIGRLSLIYGICNIISEVVILIFLSKHSEMNLGGVVDGVKSVIYGSLFLIGRDAFNAIDTLISEMQEIV